MIAFTGEALARPAGGVFGKRHAPSPGMDYTESKLQAAIQWVNEKLRGDPALAKKVLLEDAARQFDLGLKDQSELRHLFRA